MIPQRNTIENIHTKIMLCVTPGGSGIVNFKF